MNHQLKQLIKEAGLSNKQLVQMSGYSLHYIKKMRITTNPCKAPSGFIDMIKQFIASGDKVKPVKYAPKTQTINGVQYEVKGASKMHGNVCGMCAMYNSKGDYCSKPSVQCNTDTRSVYFLEFEL